MLKTILLLMGIVQISYAAIPENLLVHGIDIRNKSDRYTLSVGPENSLLDERPYKLKKITGKKEVIVRQGYVVSVNAGSKKDVEALYANESVQIQLGQPQTYLKPQKQIVVFKVKNTPNSIGQTIVFENFDIE